MALYAFDGTWNDSSAPEGQRDTNKDTNVHRFRALYGGKAEYKDGVGSRYGFIGKLIGGLTGAGAEQRIEEQFVALNWLLAKGKACGLPVPDHIDESRTESDTEDVQDAAQTAATEV